MLCNIWIWRMVLFFPCTESHPSPVQFSWTDIFPCSFDRHSSVTKAFSYLIKNKFHLLPCRFPPFFTPPFLLPGAGVLGCFCGGIFLGGLVATISDINYNLKDGGEKSSQVLCWLTEAAWDLWQSSYNIIFGMTWTWGLCKCKAKKKWKYVSHWQCIPLVMDLIIKMTNYSIKVSAQLGDTCKIRNIITYMQYIAKKLRHLSSLLGGLMWHFSCR